MNDTQTGGPYKMRANRAVVETKCLTCGNAFTFGEEVVACNVCGGYHHAACWNQTPVCRHNVAGSAAAATAGPAVPPPAPPPQPQAQAAPAAGAVPGPDEQFCPQCREIIKIGALKCRFCGYIVNAQLASQEIMPARAAEINTAANTAMWCGIVGLFICGPVLGTIALVQSNKALKEIKMAPQYSASKGKAMAGRVLGIIAWIGWAIVIMLRISNM
jgi:hypothetical protein